MTVNKAEEVIANPSRGFAHPSEVISAAELSQADKVKVLKQWELDARLFQVAPKEGMSGGEANMLADVMKAQKLLAKQSTPSDEAVGQESKGSPTKAGV